MWHVYILKCSDGALYTGITFDLKRRFEEHISGKGGFYTRWNRPSRILYSEVHEMREHAERREAQIKRWSRAKKLALIGRRTKDLKALSVSRD